MSGRATCGLVAALVVALVVADLPARQDPAEARPRLDAIHDDLVELRFEKVLAAVDALLGQTGLSEEERVEALILRSEAHVSLGDLTAVAEDWEAILRLRPAYAPDRTLTSNKAMERFQAIRASLIGAIVLSVDPPDARILVDGAEVAFDAEGRLPLVAGTHLLHAERDGFDPLEHPVEVAAAVDLEVELLLMPNARTVVIVTEPDGVEVRVDGEAVGRTVRPDAPPGSPRPAAELTIENLALGEHRFELVKPCFRAEGRRDTLTADLLDRAPKRYDAITLVPVRSRLELQGGPQGAEIFVDGESKGWIPREPIELCPGSHRVEVRYEDRTVWLGTETLDESRDRVLPIAPRPNAVLVGATSWPDSLPAFARVNRIAILPAPAGADLRQADTWRSVTLPPGTDLALVAVRARRGSPAAWYVYSPLLDLVEPIDGTVAFARPRWTTASWGLSLVDSRIGGPALVAEVVPGGAAAAAGIAPGDRIVAVGGVAVADAGQAHSVLRIASAGAPLDVSWSTPAGRLGEGRLEAAVSPLLVARFGGRLAAVGRAAWAAVDATADREYAPHALSNLALVMSAFDRHEQAIETWRRVRWPDRPGVGQGTVQYYLGRELERVGRERDAAVAYRRAAASGATTVNDEGPAVAPAARDRLADLGQVSER